MVVSRDFHFHMSWVVLSVSYSLRFRNTLPHWGVQYPHGWFHLLMHGCFWLLISDNQRGWHTCAILRNYFWVSWSSIVFYWWFQTERIHRMCFHGQQCVLFPQVTLIEIAELLYQLACDDIVCSFLWIPGHSGIAGNARADHWARMAHTKPRLWLMPIGLFTASFPRLAPARPGWQNRQPISVDQGMTSYGSDLGLAPARAGSREKPSARQTVTKLARALCSCSAFLAITSFLLLSFWTAGDSPTAGAPWTGLMSDTASSSHKYASVSPGTLQTYGLWHEYRPTLLKAIKPDIAFWTSSVRSNRKEEILLSRMRLGHTLLTHAHVIDRLPPPPLRFVSMSTKCETHLTGLSKLCKTEAGGSESVPSVQYADEHCYSAGRL